MKFIRSLDEELINKILLGARYVEQGNPLKDAMDGYDLDEAIQMFAKCLNELGFKLEEEDE